MQTSRLKAYAYTGFWIVLFLIGCIGSFSGFIQKSLIPRNFKDLVEIGTVTSIQGAAERKLLNDGLWFELAPQETLYRGDLIQTDEKSMADIELRERVFIHLQPNTFVRLRMILNKPSIDLLQGQIKVKNESPNEVFINSEEGTKKVETEKPPSFPPNDPNSPIQYPYPQNNTMLFNMADAASVQVFPKKACAKPCTLVVTKNGKFLSKHQFNKNDLIQIEIDVRRDTAAEFRWTLEDAGTISNGQFYVKPFTPGEMKTQLKLNHPIIMIGRP